LLIPPSFQSAEKPASPAPVEPSPESKYTRRPTTATYAKEKADVILSWFQERKLSLPAGKKPTKTNHIAALVADDQAYAKAQAASRCFVFSFRDLGF
jgi:hypothetical protein